jgi:hypothetical protein
MMPGCERQSSAGRRFSLEQLAQKLGFADQLVGKRDGKQNIKVKDDEPNIEDITREFNRGSWQRDFLMEFTNVALVPGHCHGILAKWDTPAHGGLPR